MTKKEKDLVAERIKGMLTLIEEICYKIPPGEKVWGLETDPESLGCCMDDLVDCLVVLAYELGAELDEY